MVAKMVANFIFNSFFGTENYQKILVNKEKLFYNYCLFYLFTPLTSINISIKPYE